MVQAGRNHNPFRAGLYALMEGGRQGYLPARFFDAAIFALIFVNVGFALYVTVPGAPAWVQTLFPTVETIVLVVFTVEYLARLWIAVEDPRHKYHHPLRGRLRFATTPAMLLDLAVLLPFYLSVLVELDPAMATVFRVLRVLKLFRATGAFGTIVRVVWNERQSLVAVATLIGVILLVVSTLAYFFEHDAQPEKFSSIPAALYWGIVTLTTVGYGDIAPVTPMGQLLAGVTTVIGVLSLALPSAIIVSGFVEELKRRDLTVTWNLVAQMPLFARFSIAQVARVAALLKLQRVEAGEVVIRRGDPADAMYFVATGEIELQAPSGLRILRDNDFFGEIGMIEGGPRTATATARTACDLLVLEAAEFQELMEEFPDVEAKVRAAMDERRRENEAASRGQ